LFAGSHPSGRSTASLAAGLLASTSGHFPAIEARHLFHHFVDCIRRAALIAWATTAEVRDAVDLNAVLQEHLPLLMSLRYVLLLQRDLQKAVRFYGDGLGLPVRVVTERWAELTAGPSTLALKATEGCAALPYCWGVG
jgi:hypothetical protein